VDEKKGMTGPNDEMTEQPEDGSPERAASEPPVEDTELAALHLANAALEDKVRRLLADAANMRRRAAEEAQRTREAMLGRILQELLPVLDAFRLALDSPGDRQALLEGVRMVHGMLEDLLYRHGVEPIPAEGQPFDPRLHEAMGVEDRADLSANTVVSVQQTGYRIGDLILRPARVIVSRAPVAGDGQ
jgi:molecular chaperone GrpE